MAIDNSIHDREEISAIRFSPWFMHYHLASNCDDGVRLIDAATFALNEGFVLLLDVEYPNFYPFSSLVLCKNTSSEYYPEALESDYSYSGKLAFEGIYAVKSLDQLKQSLHNRYPVVVGMMIPKSFEKAKSEIFRLTQFDKDNLLYGHAMTVIGFDDIKYGGSVEILNSWGENWGSDGRIYIPYDDFLEMAVEAYSCQTRGAMTYGESITIELDEPATGLESAADQGLERVAARDSRDNLFRNDSILSLFEKVNRADLLKSKN